MNVFHRNLKTIKATSFRDLHFRHESRGEIFIDNSVAGSEKGDDVLDESLLVRVQLAPMFQILLKVDLRAE